MQLSARSASTRLIQAYIKENPSVSFTLRDLGANLPAWIEHQQVLTLVNQELAVDVARLEWAYIEAFDSATLPPLDTADFATLLPTSVIGLQPHLQLLALRYAADKVVLAVHKRTSDNDIVSNAVAEHKQSKRIRIRKPKPAQTYLVVHRYQDSVYYRRVDREAFLLLSAIQQGEPIEVVVQQAFVGSDFTPSEQADKNP